MKLSKTLGTELYNLYGPNGSDSCIYRGEVQRMKVLRELERHGLVKLEERTHSEGVYEVKRQARGLKQD